MADAEDPSILDAWFKFYPQSWVGNMRLRRCTDSAKAVLMDLICLAHTSDPYGSVPNASECAVLSGRSERSFGTALDELIRAGVLDPSQDWHGKGGTFRKMTRDRQKMIAGKASWASRKGGEAPFRTVVPNGRSERSFGTLDLRSEILENETLEPNHSPSPAAPDDEPKPKKASKSQTDPKPKGTPATRLWDELWAEHRGGKYSWVKADAVAIAWCVKSSGDDLDVLRCRAIRLLSSSDIWMARNASPRTLQLKWNQLAVDIQPLTETQKAMTPTDETRRMMEVIQGVRERRGL